MPTEISMPHPGIVLREEFRKPMGLTVYALAKATHVTRSRINDISTVGKALARRSRSSSAAFSASILNGS